jgi:type VI secretion system protein ImpB
VPPNESLQHKLDRVRPPRVQITYDVETEGSPIKKELPFIVGVLADLSGHPDPDAEPPPDLKNEKRKFVEINRDNFDKVMNGIKPRLALRVPNELQKDGTKLGAELTFRSLEDFEPVNVVRQVEPLRKLLEARQRLAELKTKIVSNDRLEGLLQRIIHDTDQLKRLARETGRLSVESPASGASTQAQAGTEPATGTEEEPS